MKAITKKVPKVTGVVLTMSDVHEFLDGIEYYDDNICWSVEPDAKMTVKVKGKIVNLKDVSISFEDDK